MLKSKNIHFRATPYELTILEKITVMEELNLSEAARACIRDAGRIRNINPNKITREKGDDKKVK